MIVPSVEEFRIEGKENLSQNLESWALEGMKYNKIFIIANNHKLNS